VRETHPSEFDDVIHCGVLEDGKLLIRHGECATRIGMLVFEDDIEAFTNGAAVVVSCCLFAAYSSLMEDDTFPKRSLLSSRIYLSFDSHVPEHKMIDLGISVSQTMSSHDGSD
jgi:hypothetical protein